MAIKQLAADSVGLPAFDPGSAQTGDIFELTSHRRAREALDLALSIADTGFNVFVLGQDRSGRLTSTVAYLKGAVADRPPPSDWVYLNNFNRPWQPIPVRLPRGEGRRFRDRMERLIRQLSESLTTAFGGEEYQKRLQGESETLRAGLNTEMEALRSVARGDGLDVIQTPRGPMIVAVDENGQPVQPDQLTDEQRSMLEARGPALVERLQEIGRNAARLQATMMERAEEIGRQTADYSSRPLIDAVVEEFGTYPGLNRWLIELRNDVIERFEAFVAVHDEDDQQPRRPREPLATPAVRYSVNLFVDNGGTSHAPVVVESNPTFENLFGRIEYRQSPRGFDTDFTLIRAGALHRANGGVLVLRADAVAAAPGVWPYLKAALRDNEARIEEPYRNSGPTVAGAPSPLPIPLDIKVVLIGAPRWYYTFFSADPEFQSYFKIKADIDPDMEAIPANTEIYGGLIRNMATEGCGMPCDDAAVAYLLGMTARWAADRDKLSSQFERVADVLAEACQLGGADGTAITEDLVRRASENRRRRNSRIEDRVQEGIQRGAVLIATSGTAVGQINALTVRDVGDHAFGAPSRVTASASVGRRGVINIERDVALGGPIQQKGAMVLQGWLSGTFARAYPLSFNCSITFEQSYGGVDGDSASLAELLAILSHLADVPLRQDLAITGSVNQHGAAQAIGGAHHKIEGFFRTCEQAGALGDGTGVVIPASNERNVILREAIDEAIAGGRFAVHSVETIEDAVEIFTGQPAGRADADGRFPDGTVFARVAARLEAYDRILQEREGAF